jgi:integrase
MTQAELEKLLAAQAELRRGLLSPITRSGYLYDSRMFHRWCELHGRCALPASAETVALYLTDLLQQGKKITTARRRKCAIVHEHRAAQFPCPITSAIVELLHGAQRIRCEKPRRMRALTVEQLRRISQSLAARESSEVAIRDRALIVLGFASALRRSNLVALNLSDVEQTDEGLVLAIGREKNDPEGRGRLIGIPKGKDADTCAAAVLGLWLRIRGGADGPLFFRLDRKRRGRRLDGDCVIRIVKKGIERIGLDPADYGAHSLRAGFITEAGLAGVSPWLIATQSGHENLEVLRSYFRRGEVFRSNVAGMIGL